MAFNACTEITASKTAKKHDLRHHDWLWKQREPPEVRAVTTARAATLEKERARSARLDREATLLAKSDLLSLTASARATAMPEDDGDAATGGAPPPPGGSVEGYAVWKGRLSEYHEAEGATASRETSNPRGLWVQSEAARHQAPKLPGYSTDKIALRRERPAAYYAQLFHETRGQPGALRTRALAADVAAFADKQRNAQGKETRRRLASAKSLEDFEPTARAAAKAAIEEHVGKLGGVVAAAPPPDERSRGNKPWYTSSEGLPGAESTRWCPVGKPEREKQEVAS